MPFDDAIRALSASALELVKDGHVVGLGSGRAATVLAKSLAKMTRLRGYKILAVPTSLQIKVVAEGGGIPLAEADRVRQIDVVFDGADQIDSQGYVIKGGGGALLRENILFGMAKKTVVMADRTKFARNLSRAVPVEVHPLARNSAAESVRGLGGEPRLRTLERGYPFFTENGNIILDCDFGTIRNPRSLGQKLLQIPGVLESGIFLKRPDIIYKAKENGRYEILRGRGP